MSEKKNTASRVQSVKLVRKANNLVEGKYRFDIWEMRVFTKMLTMILPSDEDFKEYRIYLKEVIDDFNLAADKQSYKLLKDGAVKLMKKEIKIIRDTEEGEKEFLTHIAVGLDSFTSRTQGSYLDISFHPKMKPFLLQLQTQFLMYDVRNVLQLQSSYSVRIYELLKQYEKIGKRTFSVDDLKETLAVMDKYPLYANFKQRIIMKAQEDLATYTDIRFTFEEVKKGRAIQSIIFTIKSNKTIVEERKLLTPILTKVFDENSSNVEIYNLVKEFPGVNQTTINDWFAKYSHEYIVERVNILLKQLAKGKDIKNPMGYLQKLMLQDTLFTITDEKNPTKITANKNTKISEKSIKDKMKELEDLKIFYYETQNQIINEFLLKNEKENKRVLEYIQLSPHYDGNISLEENLQRVTLIAIINTKVKEAYPQLFLDLDSKYWAHEKNIKQQLRELGWIG
ncbi:replication initiation protein [Arcicella sp. LKC2W]|uniref:replication initiation protein n=1 Tax=Arcicella sp. LKC2W TaxID=2984198 RepID=UPI002B20F2A0|nr:replication initiation protein [Arcicella sp. LKC2W]MEA5461477.1 replication initiation protein [Arcicella sp. LKC2W]